MDDETEALTGATDSMGQWTIKTISMQAKNTAVAAAKMEGLTVGQWLETRIREWTGDPGAVAIRPHPEHNSESSLTALLTAAAALSAASERKIGKVPGLASLIAERIRSARGLPPLVRKSTVTRRQGMPLISTDGDNNV